MASWKIAQEYKSQALAYRDMEQIELANLSALLAQIELLEMLTWQTKEQNNGI